MKLLFFLVDVKNNLKEKDVKNNLEDKCVWRKKTTYFYLQENFLDMDFRKVLFPLIIKRYLFIIINTVTRLRLS